MICAQRGGVAAFEGDREAAAREGIAFDIRVSFYVELGGQPLGRVPVEDLDVNMIGAQAVPIFVAASSRKRCSTSSEGFSASSSLMATSLTKPSALS
jgi:hypothetical protein